MRKVLIAICGIVVVLIVAVIAVYFWLQSTADAAYYSLGKDQIISIKEVVGKRKLTAVETNTTNGVLTKIFTYQTDPDDPTQAAEDLRTYFTELTQKEGFLNLIAFDSLPYVGGMKLQLGKRSVDTGKIIILTITYDSNGYTLVFMKTEGTLTEELEKY